MRGKKGFSKGKNHLSESGFRTYQPQQGEVRITPRTKAEERTKKEKARKELILNPDSQLQKYPMKKDMPRPGNQMIGIPP